MVKSVDYSFPRVHPSSETLFSVEINKLTEIWNACCRNFEQNARDETDYKNGFEYQLLDDQGPVIVGSTSGIIGGTTCLMGGISLQFPPMLLTGMASIGASIWAWKNVIDAKHQMSHFIDVRIQSHRTIEKIEGCVRLMNHVGDLFAAWEIAKRSPSTASLTLLFKSFKRVQKAETGLLTDSMDPVLPFLLMDNICDATTSDLKIIQEWKDFTSEKTAQPPEFKYFKATKAAYFNYIIKRVGNSESQVASKISHLKSYIDQLA
jgi:hypothetical protein